MENKTNDDLGREAGHTTTSPQICPHKPGTPAWFTWVAQEIAATVEREDVAEDDDDLEDAHGGDWYRE